MGDSEQIKLNQLKDVGTSLPSAEDFEGTVMVGWNEQNPTCVYIGAKITDDILQIQSDITKKWVLDDCLEMVFDLSENNITEQMIKWVVNAEETGFVSATKENMQVSIGKDGNTKTYEIMIDLSKIDSSTLKSQSASTITAEKTIGFSIAYNDGENNEREHQIGWTAGKSSDRITLGNLRFEREQVK